MSYYGLNRTLCAVLEEMRKLDDTKNYSILKSLIEEAQVMANRMEAALYDVKDIKKLYEDRKALRDQVKKLEKKAGKKKNANSFK